MQQTVFPVPAVLFTVLTIPSFAAEYPPVNKKHTITVHQRPFCPDNGLLMGNGDLSVSVYQTADRIVRLS